MEPIEAGVVLYDQYRFCARSAGACEDGPLGELHAYTGTETRLICRDGLGREIREEKRVTTD